MKQYYVIKDGVQEGPYEEATLKADAAAGKYPKGTLIWGEGMGNWEPIEKHFAFSSAPAHNLLSPWLKQALAALKSMNMKQALAALKNMNMKKKVMIGCILCFATCFLFSFLGNGISEDDETYMLREAEKYKQFFHFAETFAEDFSDSLHYLSRDNLYDVDGERREKPLYTREEMRYKAIRGVVSRHLFHGEKYRDFVGSVYQWKELQDKIKNSHPAAIPDLQTESDFWENRLRKVDFKCTLFLTSFLAEGKANPNLARIIDIAFELKKKNIVEKTTLSTIEGLSHIYRAQKKLPNRITDEDQLTLIDSIEEEVKISGYSAPDLQQQRDQLRALLKQKKNK